MSLCYLDFFKGLYSVYWLLYEYWFSFFRKKWKSLSSILPVLPKAGNFMVQLAWPLKPAVLVAAVCI